MKKKREYIGEMLRKTYKYTYIPTKIHTKRK